MAREHNMTLYEELCQLMGVDSLTPAQIARIVYAVLQVEGCPGDPHDLSAFVVA